METAYQIFPLTEAVDEWFVEHVRAEDYEWLGRILVVECRYAPDIVQLMLEAGLKLNEDFLLVFQGRLE